MTLGTYRTLGRSGLKVSPLALGTMTFGTEWGYGSDKEISKKILTRYLEAGGNFIDTADLYTGGTSERWIGEFLREGSLRDRVVLCTKFSFSSDPENPNAGGNGRKNILRAIEGSLKRLQTDYVDLYLLHAWDTHTPVEEVMRTFEDLVRSGKVRHAGFSNVPAWYAARGQTLSECRGGEPVCALQLEYSLVERSIEREFTRLSREMGLHIMAWSPLGGGVLTGKYRPDGSGEPGRLEKTKGSGNPVFDKLTARNFTIAAELESVSREIGRSMAQVALNWVTTQPGVAASVIGATTLSQLSDNLASLDFTLPEPLRERLDKASAIEAGYPYVFFGPLIQPMITGKGTIAPPT